MDPISYCPDALRQRRQNRGAILVAVLGFILLMAIFVTQFLDITTRQMRMRAVELGRSDLRTTAYSAMEVSMAVMHEFKEIDEGLSSPSQGWGDPIGYAGLTWPEGVEVTVRIEDESGKIPLHPVPEEDIKALLEGMDIDFTEADIMIDSLVDWTDSNDAHRLNGAEDSYYEREDPPYVPANEPLTSFDNLARIRGFKDNFFEEDGTPNANYYRFINAVSLHNSGKININTAPSEVLQAYSGQTSSYYEEQFQDFKSGLDRIPGNEDDEIIRSSDDLQRSGFQGATDSLGFTMNVAKITVSVTAGEKHFNLIALVETGDNSPSESGNNEENPNQGEKPSPGGNNSSGNQGNSDFKIVRLIENANFD